MLASKVSGNCSVMAKPGATGTKPSSALPKNPTNAGAAPDKDSSSDARADDDG